MQASRIRGILFRPGPLLTLALTGLALAQAPAGVGAPTAPPAATEPALPALEVVFEVPLYMIDGGRKVYPTERKVLSIAGTQRADLAASAVEIERVLTPLLNEIPTEPRPARFEEQGGRWVVLQRNGYTVDRALLQQRVAAALADPGVRRVNVPFETRMPARTLDYFMMRGITAHLGSGHTTFHGSPDNRVTNIRVSMENFNDRLHAGNFSFLQFIGPVTRARGYVAGLVIAGERTVSGLGGGVCQTSTTAFRALYAAGLPVLERSNHSYQVFYYAPQGLDAAVFEPAPDLRFANDTGGALWFQRDMDTDEETLSIHVFGRPQTRTVQIGEPRTLSQTPPPADRVIVDRSLRPGERRQVDWAAPGATIEVERRFLEGGQVVKTETLRSVYRPWPNTFLVGGS